MKIIGKKYRFRSWWWGRYITWTGSSWKTETGLYYDPSQIGQIGVDMEIYIEEKHGLHHAVKSI